MDVAGLARRKRFLTDLIDGGDVLFSGCLREQGVHMSGTLTEHEMSTNRTDAAAMFPLPLSDFEYYMHVDDRPSHPMVFVMVVTVTGHLKRVEFQEAVDAAVMANPLFRSNVRTLPLGFAGFYRRRLPGRWNGRLLVLTSLKNCCRFDRLI